MKPEMKLDQEKTKAQLVAELEALRARIAELEERVLLREASLALLSSEANIADLARFPSENPNPVLRVDRKGTVLFANPAAQALFAKGALAIGNRLVEELRPLAEHALKTGRILESLLPCQNRWHSLTFTPVQDRDYVNIYGVDITQRKQAEDQFLKTSERLKEAQRVAAMGSWEWDPASDHASWSDQMRSVLKIPEDTPMHKLADSLALFHPKDAERLSNLVVRAVEVGASYEIKLRRPLSNGETCFLLAKGEAEQDEYGVVKRLYGTVQDVTETVRAQENLVAMKAAAEDASRAKSEFLANMSHEIRTPLNGVLGMLQLLQTTDPTDEQQEYVLVAIKSAQRLTRLLSDILDISRVEAGKLRIVEAALDIVSLKSSILELFGAMAEKKGIALEFAIDEGLPRRLMGDEARLRQILFNLVGNALKFTDHGRVAVEVCSVGYDKDSRVRVLFSISDSGVGIPDEYVGDLFEPFSQAEEAYARNFQGAGLGLAISRRLTALMGGTISVESEVGAGSTFHLCIPFGIAEPLPAKPPAREDVAARTGFRILVAEDDMVSRFSMIRMLEKLGHRAQGVQDGEQALAKLSDEHFDLALMDVQMPVLDGVAATRLIRSGRAGREKADLPIVAMTAYAMVGDKAKFLDHGMDDYVAKPVEMEELQAVLSRMDKRFGLAGPASGGQPSGSGSLLA